MTFKLKLCVTLLTLLVLNIGCYGHAQGFGILPHVPQTYHYSKEEQALRDQLKDDKMGVALGETLRPQLITALQEGYFISDDTVKQILLVWTSYHHDAKSCLDFLNELSGLIYDRPEIELHILHNKLIYLDPDKDSKEYAETNEALWKIAKYAGIRIDYYDISAAFDAAQIALKNGDKIKADVLFSRVFYYPWWKMDNSVSLEYFFNLYKQAGKQLIYIRMGDLKALQRLDFFPSVADELNPIRQQAIEETKRLDAKKKENAEK